MWKASCIGLALGLSGAAHADPFWSTWSDGRGELGGYSLTQPRYGSPRAGYAVLIYVTEDFSDSLRVKADPGMHPESDVYPILKLNVVRHFQTGIYDYSVLSSTFVHTEPVAGEAFALVKTSLSVQEWCGHVYAQWLRRGNELVGTSHSYFDGEADSSRTLTLPPGVVFEDALPILVRGLRGAFMKVAESRNVKLVGSTLGARLSHKPQAVIDALLRRDPDGSFVALGKARSAERYVLVANGVTTTWFVEPSDARRLLGWERSDGEVAHLLGSERLPYWELNKPGGEAELKKLGLRPIVAP